MPKLTHRKIYDDDGEEMLEGSKVLVNGNFERILHFDENGEISLNQSMKTTTEIEKSLKSFPEVKTIVSKCGAPAVANDLISLNQCDVFVMLNPTESWKSGLTKEQQIEKMFATIEIDAPAAASFGFMQPIEMRVNELIAGTRGDVAIKLFDHLGVLAEKGEEIEKLSPR